VFTARYGLNEDLCNKAARSYATQKAAAHCGLPFEFLCLNARLLARSQQASGRSCDLPYRHRFSVLDLGARAGHSDGWEGCLLPNVTVMLPSEHKTRPIFFTYSICCILQTVYFPSCCRVHTTLRLASSLRIFTRRTSGHCVGTLRPVLFSTAILPLNNNTKYRASRCILPLSSLYLSIYLCLYLRVISGCKPQKGLNAKMDSQPGSCSESEQSPNSSYSPSP
jgi:hypothetical protein